jgi:hypothetical protein
MNGANCILDAIAGQLVVAPSTQTLPQIHAQNLAWMR